MTLRGGPLGSSSAASTVPGWRVEDFHRLLTNFFEEGVVQGVGGALAVTERGAGANMSVDVAAGLALMEVTTTLLSPNATVKTWLYNDAVVNVAVPTADATNPRKDRIVAKFDMTVDPNATASNIVSIELIEGTPAGSPSAPAEPSNAITLAIVDVPASDTAIGNAQITDSRTYVTLDTAVLADVARIADLASTASGKGASMIGVEDSGGAFSATTVEGVLAEIDTRLDTTLTKGDIGFFGDGSDGAKTVSASEDLDPANEFEYSSLTINASQVLGVTTANTPLVIKVTGNVTINGSIDLAGEGGPAGAGSSTTNGANGTTGNSRVSGFTVTAGNGGQGNSSTDGNGAGGSGGSSSLVTGAAGSNGDGGVTGGAAPTTTINPIHLAMLTQLMRGAACGGGGGGGGRGRQSSANVAGGNGGNGGGCLVMFVGGNLTLGASSAITVAGANGSAGTNGGSQEGGAGGGGGGGSVLILVAGSITNSGVTLTVSGGNGGDNGAAGDGGAGGAGKALIFSLSTGTLVTA